MQSKSYTLPLGSTPPNFRLKGTDGKFYTLNDFANASLLVIFFTCNHCPYVKNSNEVLRQTINQYKSKQIGWIAINSNNEKSCPEDSYAHMVENMQQQAFPWIYLYDETQQVAHDYGALRTPHFFVFDKKRHLVYTGRAIDSPLNPAKMTINDLDNAIQDCLQDQPVKTPLTNPIGCTIKWIGKDKHWMPDAACDLI